MYVQIRNEFLVLSFLLTFDKIWKCFMSPHSIILSLNQKLFLSQNLPAELISPMLILAYRNEKHRLHISQVGIVLQSSLSLPLQSQRSKIWNGRELLNSGWCQVDWYQKSQQIVAIHLCFENFKSLFWN